MRHHQPHQRPAFTLIETAIALAIATILLAGLSSAIVVASRAIPTTNETGSRDRLVIDTMSELRANMRNAEQVQFSVIANGFQLRLAMKSNAITAEPTTIEYQFLNATNQIIQRIDGAEARTILTGISEIDGSTSYAGTTLHAIAIRFAADGTIQGDYEFTITLPNAPAIN